MFTKKWWLWDTSSAYLSQLLENMDLNGTLIQGIGSEIARHRSSHSPILLLNVSHLSNFCLTLSTKGGTCNYVLHVTANVQGLVTKGKLTQDKARKALSMLKGVLDYSEFKDIDMVIEVGFFAET